MTIHIEDLFKHKHRATVERIVDRVGWSGKTDYVRLDLKCGGEDMHLYVRASSHLAKVIPTDIVVLSHD
jgi:hypothetical protein